MIKYYIAEDSVREVFEKTMEEFHEELVDVELTFTVLMAVAVDREGALKNEPTLMSRGHRVAARVRKTNGAQRAAGMTDVVFEVDAQLYEGLTDAERVALVDHELEHVELVLDEDEHVRLGVDLRPVLRVKPHDAEIGVFYGVVERHGAAALDFQMAEELRRHVSAAKG